MLKTVDRPRPNPCLLHSTPLHRRCCLSAPLHRRDAAASSAVTTATVPHPAASFAAVSWPQFQIECGWFVGFKSLLLSDLKPAGRGGTPQRRWWCREESRRGRNRVGEGRFRRGKWVCESCINKGLLKVEGFGTGEGVGGFFTFGHFFKQLKISKTKQHIERELQKREPLPETEKL